MYSLSDPYLAEIVDMGNNTFIFIGKKQGECAFIIKGTAEDREISLDCDIKVY